MASSIHHPPPSPTISMSIKALVLLFTGSLWADIDLGRTTPEDRDSPLEYSIADVSLRVQL